jgi:hypothetical protein
MHQRVHEAVQESSSMGRAAVLPRVNARNFLSYSVHELWSLLEGDFIIVFPDGEFVTNERQVLYSMYVWEYFQRYPDTPLMKKHFVGDLIGSKELSSTAALKLTERVLFSVYDAYEARVPNKVQLLDDLAKLAYEINNTMYNELQLHCSRFVTGLDITDFTEITTNPVLDQRSVDMPLTDKGVQDTHAMVIDLINNSPLYKRNPLAVAIRTGIARMGQALQCLGPRGFLTDMDSNIFMHPITTSYVQGVRTLYDSMIESRSAAKSLMNSTKPLQDAEYFSRRQQLICMNVKRLHHCDCGSKNYLLWHVRDVRYEGENKVSDGDLKTIVGKYYLDEETGGLKVVREGDRHLIGKTIKMRSPVAGCSHPDPYGICSTCYGEGSLAIPADSNLGHIACVSMTALIGQLILSTKHFDGSASVESIVLGALEKKYLEADLMANAYYLHPKLKGREVKLYLPREQAPGLPDIKMINNVEELNVSRISTFETITMTVQDKDGVGTEMVPLETRVKARYASLTHDFLRYLKQVNYRITEGGDYEFDLSKWDVKLPMFVLPMSHFNMSDHQRDIAVMLESTAEELEKRSAVISPSSMLVEFYDLVNHRLSVNLSVLEVILYSSMVVSAMDNNYDLPKTWTSSGVGVMRMLLRNRSLSAQMGYEKHHHVFVDPASYVERNRMDHIFDGILIPELFNDPRYRNLRST